MARRSNSVFSRGTKRSNTLEVLERIRRGPAFLEDNPQLAAQYALWANTWLVEQVKELVPQLDTND